MNAPVANKVTQLSIWRALNAALRDAMAADPTVFLMGEDITSWGTGGGIYGVTRKLVDEFGPERVRNTPISEEVIISAGVGAAMRGSRPIVEIMYSDFILLGMDAVINQAAKARYMFGGQFGVPMVLRTNQGSGMGKAGQHSQCLETLYAHIPGLEVITPGTSDDAYGLLRSAVDSPNPTIFLEHKALYNERGPVTYEKIPIGKAKIAREGKDITVVATQLQLHRALQAAETLAAEGIEIEVVDPRTIAPLDINTIIASVEKTGRLLVSHEAHRLYGWGGEVVAQVIEGCVGALRSPPRRLGGKHAPVSYAEAMEQAVMPSVDDIIAEVKLSVGR